MLIFSETSSRGLNTGLIAPASFTDAILTDTSDTILITARKPIISNIIPVAEFAYITDQPVSSDFIEPTVFTPPSNNNEILPAFSYAFLYGVSETFVLLSAVNAYFSDGFVRIVPSAATSEI